MAPLNGNLKKTVAIIILGAFCASMVVLLLDLTFRLRNASEASARAARIAADAARAAVRVRDGKWQIELDLTTGKGVISLPAEPTAEPTKDGK